MSSKLTNSGFEFGLAYLGLYLIFQNTLLLRVIPGLNELGKILLGNKQCLDTFISGFSFQLVLLLVSENFVIQDIMHQRKYAI